MPGARRARGHEHRDVRTEALAPVPRRRARRPPASTRSALESASTRGSAARRASWRSSSRSIVAWLATGSRAVERREVEHVHEQPRALDVGEELVAESGALARALDQARDVGDDQLALGGRRACRAPARAS